MQRARDAGAVVLAELGHLRDDMVDVLLGHFALVEDDLATAGVARGWHAAEVQHHLEQPIEAMLAHSGSRRARGSETSSSSISPCCSSVSGACRRPHRSR